MINKVILIGRLGKDPESRYSTAGDAICNFSLATDRGYGDKKTTDWHNIVCFKKTAEFCQTYLAKGGRVYVEGSIAYQSWEKDGQKHFKTEILASNVQALSEKKVIDNMARSQADSIPSDDIPF